MAVLLIGLILKKSYLFIVTITRCACPAGVTASIVKTVACGYGFGKRWVFCGSFAVHLCGCLHFLRPLLPGMPFLPCGSVVVKFNGRNHELKFDSCPDPVFRQTVHPFNIAVTVVIEELVRFLFIRLFIKYGCLCVRSPQRVTNGCLNLCAAEVKHEWGTHCQQRCAH
jgi:hypothetical protein